MKKVINVLRRSFKKITPQLKPSELAISLRDEGLTYLNDQKLSRLEQSLVKVGAKHVEGSYLEFGVALGGSSILIAHAAKKQHRLFVGFDVFGMIPEPTSEKDDQKSRERYQEIEKGGAVGLGGKQYYGYIDNLYERVQHVFKENDLELAPGQIELHKGLFEETVPNADIQSIAFAHIDCDWYDPVAFCLSFVASKLSLGGVVLIDDYFNYGGARKATDEFILNNPEFQLELGANVLLFRRRKTLLNKLRGN